MEEERERKAFEERTVRERDGQQQQQTGEIKRIYIKKRVDSFLTSSRCNSCNSRKVSFINSSSVSASRHSVAMLLLLDCTLPTIRDQMLPLCVHVRKPFIPQHRRPAPYRLRSFIGQARTCDSFLFHHDTVHCLKQLPLRPLYLPLLRLPALFQAESTATRPNTTP